MRVFVPYDPATPKTRLSGCLSLSERQAFARAMFRDVRTAIEEAGHRATILTTEPVDTDTSVVDDRPLSEAVNGVLSRSALPVCVLMADLPLVTGETIERLLSRTGDVTIAPGLGGGTNGLVVRDETFTVDYHGCSYRDHIENARDAGLTMTRVDSHRLAVDVDEPADLTEVLLHSDGHASAWLRDTGFELDTTEGRVRTKRTVEGVDG